MKTSLIVGLAACLLATNALPAELRSSLDADARLRVPLDELQQQQQQPKQLSNSPHDDEIAVTGSAEGTAGEEASATSEAVLSDDAHKSPAAESSAERLPGDEPAPATAGSTSEEESSVREAESAAGNAESAADASSDESESMAEAASNDDAAEASNDVEDPPADEAHNQAGDNEAMFTGMLPSEMSRWIQDESVREDNQDQQPVTADADDLKREADDLRTAEFVSDIVAVLENGAV
ncbi:hypothetical protein IWW55_005287 [Coemansia sp. RSA 2706]|nr:hypothetical protein IWW55_005287 [Coemansia sp. RSA 2706]